MLRRFTTLGGAEGKAVTTCWLLIGNGGIEEHVQTASFFRDLSRPTMVIHSRLACSHPTRVR